MGNHKLKLLVIILMHICCINVYSQYYCTHEVRPDNSIIIKAVYNEDKNHFIDVYIDGKDCGRIKPNSSATINQECKSNVKVNIQGAGTKPIFNAKEIISKNNETKAPIQIVSNEPSVQHNVTQNPQSDEHVIKPTSDTRHKTTNTSVEAAEVINSFKLYVDNVKYYSNEYYNNFQFKVNTYIQAMKGLDSKVDYIRNNQLNGYLSDAKDSLKVHQDNVEEFYNDFLRVNFPNVTINDKQECIDQMNAILLAKLDEREKVIKDLEAALVESSDNNIFDKILNEKSMLMNIVIAILLFVILLYMVLRFRQRKAAKTPTVIPVDAAHQNAQADIVVRRKTTSILKKQSLEDVHNNSAYLKIDCADFCEDSAVRRIYFKNTCIKDIYNMYAEDLRNPENPNEDGCMVLGRWVHDAEADEYYVSLEEIVKPGDDAVFKEYELNFGGKIKLKVSEKLRKLRRETNLQYDMTCWVHSHPGLGVFFSNADSGVQMQLKHPTHPKFLTAIVIDILTPDQELGIFTFKHDMSINSKPELKKMYSLEEMYKWAVSSDRNSFKPEDYYNLMLASKERTDFCYGVQLSNGAIIDICQMEVEQQTGLVGWVQGYNCKKDSKNDFVVKSVSKEKAIPDNDTLGCFIIGSHRSLPTIRKAITNADNIQFVLFYSTSDKMLTAIPIVNGQLSIEENYYGEEKLEELKIWTRRKR